MHGTDQWLLEGQPFGTKARQILADKVFQKQIRVEKVTIGRYKRLVERLLTTPLSAVRRRFAAGPWL